MNNRYLANTIFLFLACILLSTPIKAEEAKTSDDESADEAGDEQPVAYTKKGADTCLKCHDEDSEFPVFSIFKTKHAQPEDERTPFAGLQCESCHGPGAKHAKKVRRGQPQGPIINFGDKSLLSTGEQNQICLDCHEKKSRIAWKGSAHENEDIACTNCHEIHAAQDDVLVAKEQPEVCYKCHLKVRADFYKPSVHPVRFGQITCTECHNTHGSITDSLLARPTLNETCYTCHAEKRGPLLWEHAPVPEDCTLCHVPHGSIHSSLLTKRPPLLCQQCHSQAGHPSVAYTKDGLPGGNPSPYLLVGGCLNCHSQVHGSNHPSGVKLMR
jgi:DmsE family decaheme c-type cytochrome